MKLIATSKIGNFPVKIWETTETKAQQAYGFTGKTEDATEIHVALDPDMPPALYWETFWHEIAHAFEMAYGQKIPHSLVHVMGVGYSQLVGGLKWVDKPSVPTVPSMVQPVARRARRKKGAPKKRHGKK